MMAPSLLQMKQRSLQSPLSALSPDRCSLSVNSCFPSTIDVSSSSPVISCDNTYEKIQRIYPRQSSLSSDISSDEVKSPPTPIANSTVNSLSLSESSAQSTISSTASSHRSPVINTSLSPVNDHKYPGVSQVFYQDREYKDNSSSSFNSTRLFYNDVQPAPTYYSSMTVPTPHHFQNISVMSTNSNSSPQLNPCGATISARYSKSSSNRRKLISDEPVPCALCKRKIENKHLLYALDKYWHEKCLKCDFCRKPLYKFGCRFYFRQGAKFCHEDFMRTFGGRGTCSMCEEVIPPTDYVLRFQGNLVYHLNCFKCCTCKKRFCVGDPVKITDPKMLLCSDCKTQSVTTVSP